jgi:hypothetical protein
VGQDAGAVQRHQYPCSFGAGLAVKVFAFTFKSAGKHHQPADYVLICHVVSFFVVIGTSGELGVSYDCRLLAVRTYSS